MAQWEAVRRGPLVHTEECHFTGDTKSGTCGTEPGKAAWLSNSMVAAVLGPHCLLATMRYVHIYRHRRSPICDGSTLRRCESDTHPVDIVLGI